MGSATNKEKVGEIVMKCQEWWVQNSLYLTAESRKAFADAFHAAFLHPNLLEDGTDSNKIEENWKDIRQAGEVIVKAVSLPSWGEDEFRPVDEPTSKSG